MEYTKEEIQVINESFQKVRHEFDHDFSIDNDAEVIKALQLHKSRYYMNTGDQAIAAKIFNKHGLWKNGRITIIEHDRAELQKKVEQTIRLKTARKKQLHRLKDLQVAINESIKKVEESPKQITNRLYEERKKLQAQAYNQLESMSKKMQSHLKETVDQITVEFNEKKTIILNDLRDDIEQLKLQEKSEIDALLKEYDALMKLKQEYEVIEQDYQGELEGLKIEAEKTDASLFDFTVRELKEMADKKGIEYSSRIVKADLVDLIESNDNNDELIFEE